MPKKLLLIILLIVGCDNSTEPEDVNPLIGEWELIEHKYQNEDEGISITTYPNYNQENPNFLCEQTNAFLSNGLFMMVQKNQNSIDTLNKFWYSNGINEVVVLNCDTCSYSNTDAIYVHYNYSIIDSSNNEYLLLNPIAIPSIIHNKFQKK